MNDCKLTPQVPYRETDEGSLTKFKNDGKITLRSSFNLSAPDLGIELVSML